MYYYFLLPRLLSLVGCIWDINKYRVTVRCNSTVEDLVILCLCCVLCWCFLTNIIALFCSHHNYITDSQMMLYKERLGVTRHLRMTFILFSFCHYQSYTALVCYTSSPLFRFSSWLAISRLCGIQTSSSKYHREARTTCQLSSAF